MGVIFKDYLDIFNRKLSYVRSTFDIVNVYLVLDLLDISV